MSLRRADDNSYVLGTGLTATGASVAIRGGEYLFIVAGSVGSASAIALEVQAPDGTWSKIQVFTGSVVSFPVAQIPTSQTGIDLPACNVRAAIAGGAATSINVWLIGLG